jgi:hypothetical protein
MWDYKQSQKQWVLFRIPNNIHVQNYIMQTIPFYYTYFTGAGVWHSFVNKWFTTQVRRDNEAVLTENWVMLGTW